MKDRPTASGDKNVIVLFSCGIIGIGMLLPMNFYYNADTYWKYKWRVINNSTQSFDLGESKPKVAKLSERHHS